MFSLFSHILIFKIVILFSQPSRELAEQTLREINNFKKYLDAPVIRTMLAAGGVPIKDQLNDLSKGVRYSLKNNDAYLFL